MTRFSIHDRPNYELPEDPREVEAREEAMHRRPAPMPSDEMRRAIQQEILAAAHRAQLSDAIGRTEPADAFSLDLADRILALLSEREPDAWASTDPAAARIISYKRAGSYTVPVYIGGSPPSRQPEPEGLDVDAFRELLAAATSLADEHGVEIGDPDTYPVHHWYEWERLSHAVARVSRLAAGPSPSAGDETNG